MNIWMTLQKAVSLYPAKIGVVDGAQRFTYTQVGQRVGSLGLFLRRNGIRSRDRIAILEINSHRFLEAYYASAGIGAILTPLNFRLSAKELAYILRDSQARWLLANARFAHLVEATLKEDNPLEGIIWIERSPDLPVGIPQLQYEEALLAEPGQFLPEPISEDQVAHLYYTSGTTGKPKGVILTHRNVCVHALGTIAELHLTDRDVWAHVAAMFHLADAWATFAITWVGGRHVMVPEFEPEMVLATIERERVTISNLIPTMLNLMVKHPRAGDYDYSSLRVILSGGAPIAPEVVRKIVEVFGCDYIQTYGMTETSPYLTLSILKEHLRELPGEEQLRFKAKTGRPFIAVDLQVVDEEGRPVAADEKSVGEIWVRGQTVTPGYWNLPEETQKAFHQGWLKTGDLAVVDSEGYVNIVDRKKDMILTGGENVYSTEVENVLYMHPKILEAAVFGVPDEKWGEAVKAAVVLKSGESATPEEIISFCKERLAHYKCPKSVDFLPELPKTGSGKITKKALRDPYWAGYEKRVH
ncbi:MAG: long-chain-fatty-acid--CoA ligase [Thermodesulfobacteriota bacterium]